MGSERKRQNARHPGMIVLGGIFLALFLFAGYHVVRDIMDDYHEESEMRALAETVRQVASVVNTKEPEDKLISSGEDTGGISENPQDVYSDEKKQGLSESTVQVSKVIAQPQASEHESAEMNDKMQRPAEEESVAEKEPEPLPEYEQIYAMNSDFYGWIRIDGTNIDYPVMFAPEKEDYYLKHAFDGSESNSGTPYVDDYCDPDSNYCLIHGHHMKSKIMFGQLVKYTEREFWEEHPFIQFDNRFEHRIYEIAVVFQTQVYPLDQRGVFRYNMYTSLDDPDVFEGFISQIEKRRMYDTGVEICFGDEIIALSTCSYHTEDGRLVVVARRIEDDE